MNHKVIFRQLKPKLTHMQILIRVSKILAITPDYDLALKLYANNILNKTVRNHESFVKDHVPVPGGNVGYRRYKL